MKFSLVLLLFIMVFSCRTENESPPYSEVEDLPQLTLKQAHRLAELPLDCVQTEYPNRLGQTLGDSTDLQSPRALHPSFYGCFDWHSAVHGHWSLVRLLRMFPRLEQRPLIEEKLLQNLSKAHIKKEVAYFNQPLNRSFERTYGWAWLLKLAQELHTWEAPLARQLEANLQPLTDLIVEAYIEFLPKLNYPIRVGEHPNTAFGLRLAYDYAMVVGHEELANSIKKRASAFYLKDKNCPLDWEPGGFDFLSPCLEEAALMKHILPEAEFQIWLTQFLPQLKQQVFNLEVGIVSDRSDGKLVHLDGVNFSRAWCLKIIAEDLPEYGHLNHLANKHINYSLPHIFGDGYEGGHWLGSFALYALSQ